MCLIASKTWILLSLEKMRILYPCLDLALYMLLWPWNKFRNVYVCCWMFWCIAGTIRMSFGSKIGDLVPQTRRTTLLAKFYANSVAPQKSHAPGALLAQPSGMANLILACWPSLGSVVRSDAFLSSFYNFITPKQHLGNAHNIKWFLKWKSWWS
jgi:hypothetical protein